MTLRIVMLRILLAWWMIPASWIVVFPLFALLGGVDEAMLCVIDLNDALWNGIRQKN